MKRGMTDRNPHTGEKLQSKANSDKYRDNHARVFGETKCSACGEKRQFWYACDMPDCPNQNFGISDNA